MDNRGIKLHKIVSPHNDVLAHFLPSERELNRSTVEFDGGDDVHRALGIAWDVKEDSFLMNVDLPVRPFSRRGVLATVNSIFDPIGFAGPLTLGGKLIQRAALTSSKAHSNSNKVDWDEPLPELFIKPWSSWLESLKFLSKLKLKRCLINHNSSDIKSRSLHAFSDAAKDSIGSAIYLRTVDSDDCVHVAFIAGDSRLAPKAAASIPRLELCAAVETARLAYYYNNQFTTKISDVHFYTDSKVVLGY